MGHPHFGLGSWFKTQPTSGLTERLTACAQARALDQDPAAREGWEDLGHAYAGAGQHDKAVLAFKKELELDPDSAHGNADLASE
jgi:cytochrome c-type biogenesis protein CcmH/NrfG